MDGKLNSSLEWPKEKLFFVKTIQLQLKRRGIYNIMFVNASAQSAEEAEIYIWPHLLLYY